jgi:hypothetical protein
MKELLSWALAGFLASAAGLGAVRADGPAADKTDKPAQTAPKVVAPLTDESLGAMLENMGFEAKPEKLEKTTVYHLKIEQHTWVYYINVALSTDKEQQWITTNVADVPADEKVPAEKLLRLLEENNDIGPSAVYYDKKIKRIAMGLALTNRGGLTPAVFRTHLTQFMADVKEVQKLCDFPKADDKAEVKKDDDKAADKK